MAIEALADFPQRLEDVGTRALGRTVEALADRVVVELVNLAQNECGALFQRQLRHARLDQRARLLEDGFALGAAGVELGARGADRGVRPRPPFLAAEMIAADVRRDGE